VWGDLLGDPNPRDFLRAVLDPIRLATLGASVRSPAPIEALVERLGVERRAVAEAIGSLRATGLLTSDGIVDEHVLRSIAGTLPPKEPGLGEPVPGPWTDDEADLLGRFFADGRLVEIPASATKRRLVLDKITQEFDPGVRYLERDVNFRIQLIHPDYAAIRRYLVDGGFLARADGVYWRTGGRYEVPVGEVPDQRILAVPLTTMRNDVTVRPWDESMVDGLIQAADDPRIAAYMGDMFPNPYTREDAHAWIEVATMERPPTQYAVFVDDRLAGGVGGIALDAEATGVVEIGWWLNPDYWGRGIATLAARALIHELFANRGMERVWAPIMAPNVASARVAEKCGMVLEGIAPSYYVKSGVRHDQLNYGITRARWADR